MWNPFKTPSKKRQNRSGEAKPEELGDGKAIYLDEGFHEEAVDLERESTGLKAWYERIKRL